MDELVMTPEKLKELGYFEKYDYMTDESVSPEYVIDRMSLELGLYRQFFQQWERLHSFKGSKELQMECAQQLVETAYHIRELSK